jgi:hypothetical protein
MINNLQKIRIKQKQAIRIICNANFRAHTGPLFKQQKILPFDKLIEFSRIKFMHSFHFKLLPMSFAKTWITNGERNPDRMLRNSEDYYIPAHRVEFVKRLQVFTLPAAWGTMLLVKNSTLVNICI